MGIFFDNERMIWVLSSREMAYSLGVDPKGNLQHLYWGRSLPYEREYPAAALPKEYGFDSPMQQIKEEYPPCGGMRFKEGALKVHYPGGERDLALSYQGHQIKEDELIIALEDPVFSLIVYLHYGLHPSLPIIKRWSSIENRTKGHVHIAQVYSGCLHLPPFRDYRLSYLSGKWVGETIVTRAQLSPGKKVLESRRGIVGHCLNPFFAIDDSRAYEEWGLVYYGALAYSGSFRLVFELEGSLQALAGINDFDFSLTLEEGETFTTPALLCGLSTGGFEEVSHHLHQYQYDLLIAENRRSLPVIYNSWEVEGFGVTESRQMELATEASRLGVEIFVLDDGWFYRRDCDQRGLGDWSVDEGKFPDGLEPLISHVRKLGMGFGLWVEPEMVNPDSILYRNHPHWIYRFPSRDPSLYRNQLILNLNLKEVQDFVQKTLEILIERYQLDFLKWDMNRPFSEPGAMDLPFKDQQSIWYGHVEALYDILGSIRRRYPQLIIEACSGGGGRVDLGILQHVNQFWPSDNTDPYDRLFIQEGFSFVYAPCAMGSWVTDAPHWLTKRSAPLSYRFHVAMMGSLGLGGNISTWGPSQLALAKEKIEEYKGIRKIIQAARIYRLLSPREGPLTAVEYLAQDRSEALVYLFLMGERSGPHTSRVRLRGLKKRWLYRAPNGEILSGQALMERGLSVSLEGDFSSSLLHIIAVEKESL